MKSVITTDDILGKFAVDPEGEILGVVTKLHISNSDKKIVGVTVDHGFMKPDLYIGSDFIRNFGVDAILLREVPLDKLIGLNVLTSKGVFVGKVKDVEIEKKIIKTITVSGSGLIRSKKIVVAYSDIKEIGHSIVLNKGVKV